MQNTTMALCTKMRVTYIDPDQRALYVAELPDGGFGAWAQRGKEAPCRLVSKDHLKPEGYPTPKDAQDALDLYVVDKRLEDGQWARWDYFVNGKRCASMAEVYAIGSGELPMPAAVPPDAMVTLAQIEYRIAMHIQGAYENLLEVGRCLQQVKDSDLVAHGEWEAWVRRNTGMSERSAQRLMQAARSVHTGSMMERLPITKIQAILALPEPEREAMATKASDEGMSLRELQEAVKREKERADMLMEINVETNARAAASDLAAEKARSLSEVYELAQQKSEARIAEAERVARKEAELRASEEIEALHQKLAMREQAAPAAGISAEAQGEIDQLKAQLEEAEAYADAQADKRREAESAMLMLEQQSARGELCCGATGLTAADVAAAVRAFMGSAGVLPHMGVTLSGWPEADRQEAARHIDMLYAWVQGARDALDVLAIEASPREEGVV
ncbi:MAG: DUF3102 domain-containing protein [Clostridia bacterium]